MVTSKDGNTTHAAGDDSGPRHRRAAPRRGQALLRRGRWDYHSALADESDRGAAVLAVAHFEIQLRDEMTHRLELDDNEKLRKKIFDCPGAPLSSFSAKIDVAGALGLYSQKTLTGLHIVRKIRNKFAHSSTP